MSGLPFLWRVARGFGAGSALSCLVCAAAPDTASTQLIFINKLPLLCQRLGVKEAHNYCCPCRAAPRLQLGSSIPVYLVPIASTVRLVSQSVRSGFWSYCWDALSPHRARPLFELAWAHPTIAGLLHRPNQISCCHFGFCIALSYHAVRQACRSAEVLTKSLLCHWVLQRPLVKSAVGRLLQRWRQRALQQPAAALSIHQSASWVALLCVPPTFKLTEVLSATRATWAGRQAAIEKCLRTQLHDNCTHARTRARSRASTCTCTRPLTHTLICTHKHTHARARTCGVDWACNMWFFEQPAARLPSGRYANALPETP